MSDDHKVGYGKPPAKNKFQKGKSGNPSGRPKWKKPPKEPLDFQKELIAELKSSMTINEAGVKKKVAKLQAFVKLLVADALHDKGKRKDLSNLLQKLPKEAFIDNEVYTYRVTQADRDRWEKIEEVVATWNSGEATKNLPED